MESATDVLKLLIRNMQVQQKNMDWLKNEVDKKIIEAVNDPSAEGKFNKRELIARQLDHERYTNAQKAVFIDIEEWAKAYLEKLGGVKD